MATSSTQGGSRAEIHKVSEPLGSEDKQFGRVGRVLQEVLQSQLEFQMEFKAAEIRYEELQETLEYASTKMDVVNTTVKKVTNQIRDMKMSIQEEVNLE